MENLLIGIAVTVVGGLILYYIFGIGKQKKAEQTHSIGIFNSGKGTKITDNFIEGFDVGIKNNGEDMIAKRNKITVKQGK